MNAVHPLLAQLPTTGYIVQAIPVGPGIVTVEATPDGRYGAYEVTGYRPLATWEIESQQADFPGETDLPTVAYVTACILQDAAGIDAEIVRAVKALTERLTRDAALYGPETAHTANPTDSDPDMNEALRRVRGNHAETATATTKSLAEVA
jgi:hypothetical protein